MLYVQNCLKTTVFRFVRQISREKSSYQSATFGVNAVEKPKRWPQNISVPFSCDLSAELRQENAQFMLVFPDVIQHLTKFTSKQHEFELRDVAKHFTKALEYNVPHGKKIRGLTAAIVYKELIGKCGLTPENVRLAHILGWCIEILQSVFLVSDDIIDGSQIRRNKPCWYILDDVKSIAVNDVFMLENGCYLLLKKFFGHLSCYPSMFQLLHETAMKTFIGQSLDFQIGNGDVTQFSIEKHICISNYKTSHFAFYTPIAMSMLLAGYTHAKMFNDIKAICYELGHFYQVQNDFLDCFGDPDVLKKPGTDIEDGKCTWLAVSAMELASNKQKGVLVECYGRNDAESINRVKQVYNELDLPELYSHHEEKTYNNIKSQIEEFSQQYDLPPTILLQTLNRTFNRT